MVINIQPIYNCINFLKKSRDYDEIIYLTPDGTKLNQSLCNNLSLQKNIILLCGHYKGIDQRVRDHLITKEIVKVIDLELSFQLNELTYITWGVLIVVFFFINRININQKLNKLLSHLHL
mgnify:CR=1 FL=1